MYGEYEEKELEHLHQAELIILKDFQKICEKYAIPYFVISGTAIGAVRHGGFIPWDDDIDVAMLRPDYERFAKAVQAGADDRYYMMGPEFPVKQHNLLPAFVRKDTLFVTEQSLLSGYKPGLYMDVFVYDNLPMDPTAAGIQVKICKILNVLYLWRNLRFDKLIHTQKSRKDKAKYLIAGIAGNVLRLIPGSREMLYQLYKAVSTRYSGLTNRYSAMFDPGAGYMYVDRKELYPAIEMPFEDTTVPMVHAYKDQLSRHMGKDYMVIPPEEKRTNHHPLYMEFEAVFKDR